ncbi:hypothetical protein AMECASPLE_027684 [Ameca splendens]|uniref:Tc1-like transposase DDE domain-containing protein n=1 Tax=Ameca splendens TaxID=208324 RepID=A0ABV0XU44_9TELE
MMVATSCYGDVFLQHGQGSWSELMRRSMSLNRMKRKPVTGYQRLETRERFTFQQDNYFSTATEWFRSKQVQVLEWPSQSPNLNLIAEYKRILHFFRFVFVKQLENPVSFLPHRSYALMSVGLLYKITIKCAEVCEKVQGK